MVKSNFKLYAYPYDGYWVDVGTVDSYWKAHMDLLVTEPPLNLYDRSWIIHTRTEERPPVKISPGALIENSLICDGCIIENNTKIERSVLSPGVTVKSGATIVESVILTDTTIFNNSIVEHAIIDKRVKIGDKCKIGSNLPDGKSITMIGKAAVIPAGTIIGPGAMIGTDVNEDDFSSKIVESGRYLKTRRTPREI